MGTKSTAPDMPDAPAELNGTAEPAAVAADQEIPLSVQEFCTRLSQADRRVELIGAFHSMEVMAGRTKDVESAFSKRFNEFVNQPA